MLKNLLISTIVTVVLVTSGVTGYHFLVAPKVAYIKTAELLEQYKAMKMASAIFEGELRISRSNLDTLHNRYLRAKNDLSLKKKSPEKWGYQLAEREGDFTKYQKQGDEQLQKRRNELSAIAINKINSYVEEYGKKNNYTIIFGANGNGSIMYGKDAIDLTKLLTEELNKKFSSTDSTQLFKLQP